MTFTKHESRTSMRGHGTLLALPLLVLLALSRPCVAHEDHGEMFLYSTEDGSGTIVVDYPFDDPILVEEGVCTAGQCLYTATTPDIVAEQEQPLEGLFFIDNAIPLTLEIVDLSDEVSLAFGSVILDTPGQIIRLGFSPFHAHTTYRVEVAEGVEDDFFVTLKITSSAPFYLDSAEYTLLLTNEHHHETTTTTLAGEPICGDGLLSAGEACDDGDTEWAAGRYCRSDCTMVECGDPDDSTASSATDALIALRTAVGIGSCDACVCDVDSSGGLTPVSASDALQLLRVATGASDVSFVCPSCS
ncbi:MAG: hypothetical protein E4H03_12980 [Myxococcales bacterium]|nr:MAG: hypothetical protein E4H03_12980 [Myxococcales bacterium]